MIKKSKIVFNETYLYKLHLLTNELDKTFDQVLRIYANVTLSQFMLLIAVSEHEAINQRKVAQFLQVSPAAIKRQTDMAVQKRWLIAATRSQTLGLTLQLTPGGNTAIEKGVRVLEQHVFKVFADNDRHTDLMTHIDLLLNYTKGVRGEEAALSKSRTSNNGGFTMSAQIPKARKLYRGDINEAVITVQKITGFNIDPKWWDRNVGNNGTSEQILDRFDKAYERDFGAKITAQQTSR